MQEIVDYLKNCSLLITLILIRSFYNNYEAWMVTKSSICLVIWLSGGLLVRLFMLFREFTRFEQGYKGWDIVQDMVPEPLWKFLLMSIERPMRISIVPKVKSS